MQQSHAFFATAKLLVKILKLRILAILKVVWSRMIYHCTYNRLISEHDYLLVLQHVRGGGLMGKVDSMQLLQLMRMMMMLELMDVGALEPLPTTKKTSVVEHVFRRRIQRPVVAFACRQHRNLRAIEKKSFTDAKLQTLWRFGVSRELGQAGQEQAVPDVSYAIFLYLVRFVPSIGVC